MHIPDGMLPLYACVGAYAATGGIAAYTIKKIKEKEDPKKQIPKVSIVTAAFFVGSLINIPIPPTSVHLMLTGTLGILVGDYAFLSVIVSLFFQAALFGHGGLTTIGINTIILGIPAIVSSIIYKKLCHSMNDSKTKNTVLSFFIGAFGTLQAVIIFCLIILGFIPKDVDVVAERMAVYGSFLAHMPLVLLEGIFTAWIVTYLKKVKPEILEDHK
ncbi:cobalt transporter CbiM [Anaerophilus nitritogenes]|uniref:cobalt transporter CbiM n=1 Tax=Anaerophilus nitritogenes TaxID=2498136 RepID=UPI00101BD479|nr:cobalt transporter CbiM [Anaerophilus nitritogenes]